ncbi:MAG: hypothetical protein R3F43_13065 [bacterium]
MDMGGATMTCDAWHPIIRDALAERLGPSAYGALRAHLAACAACRARYDRAADGVALLEGRPGGLTEAARDQGRAALFAALDGREPEVESPATPTTPRGRPMLRGVLAATLLLAAAGAAFVRWQDPRQWPPALQARGARAPTRASSSSASTWRATSPASGPSGARSRPRRAARDTTACSSRGRRGPTATGT